MTRTRATLALLLLALPLTLAGCGGKSLEQRLADRTACESIGGTYVEWTGALATDRLNRCDLNRKASE